MADIEQSRWTDAVIELIQSIANDETVTTNDRADNLGSIEVALESARDHLEMRRDEGAE